MDKDVEARSVVRNGEALITLLLKASPGVGQIQVWDNPGVDRGTILVEGTGEVLASNLQYRMADAATDVWLEGFGRGYDAGYERGKSDASK